MNDKNTKYLYVKYPEIFRQHTLPMQETCMCWDFCCGDGWFELIDALCNHITSMCKNNDWKIPEALQVKEKYGGLRFYIDGVDYRASETVMGGIEFAEALSYRICESCGRKGEPNNKGLIRTLCSKCRIKNDKGKLKY